MLLVGAMYCILVHSFCFLENIPHNTACTNGLPDDEHMIFESCRRRQELN